MDDFELKPCPFCGHEAYLESFPVRKGFEAVVQCYNCNANMQTVTFDTEEAAQQSIAEEWNRRTPMVPPESHPIGSSMCIGRMECNYDSVYTLMSEPPREVFVPGRFVRPVKGRMLSFRLMDGLHSGDCIQSTIRLTPNQYWKVKDYDDGKNLVTLSLERNTIVLPMFHASLLFEDYDQTKDGRPLYPVCTGSNPE